MPSLTIWYHHPYCKTSISFLFLLTVYSFLEKSKVPMQKMHIKLFCLQSIFFVRKYDFLEIRTKKWFTMYFFCTIINETE